MTHDPAGKGAARIDPAPPARHIGDALAQARHRFLGGNDLPARWRQRQRFVVVETGFGSGLNFLATWQAWRDDPARSERLHYVSLEEHPFSATDLATLQASWPELAPLAAELRRRWPPLVPGLHRLHLDDGRVVLDLVLGDAQAGLPRLVLRADAFYVDDRTPEMQDRSLLAGLSALAATDATLATGSIADGVHEALADAGWQLEKTSGHAGKREMLRGWRGGGATLPTRPDNTDVIVIGTGLAGSTVAARLAARGWHVTVVDALGGPGEGASGNRAGVLRPLPSRDDNALARITRAGFLATANHLQALDDAGLAAQTGELWGRTGVLHLARDDRHAGTQRRIVAEQAPPADYLRFVEREEASALCGWPVAAGGWWFPGGAWVSPANYCRANLLRHAASIDTRYSRRIERIAHESGRWRTFDGNGACVAEAAQLVVANAADARRLLGDWLPIFPARGQVTHLPASAGSPPRCVVCRLGYVTPAIDGQRFAGATFLMRDDDPALRTADHADNLAKLDFMLPGYAADLPSTGLAGRVGFRPASPDRLPIVGAVPMLGDAAAPPGLWLVDGFGARGIVWSALAAELLADMLEDSPRIVAADLVGALAPARFVGQRRRQRGTSDEQDSAT